MDRSQIPVQQLTNCQLRNFKVGKVTVCEIFDNREKDFSPVKSDTKSPPSQQKDIAQIANKPTISGDENAILQSNSTKKEKFIALYEIGKTSKQIAELTESHPSFVAGVLAKHKRGE